MNPENCSAYRRRRAGALIFVVVLLLNACSSSRTQPPASTQVKPATLPAAVLTGQQLPQTAQLAAPEPATPSARGTSLSAPLAPAPSASETVASPSGLSASTTVAGPTPIPMPATQVIDYVAQRPPGEPRTGSCWTNSLAVPNRLAWRCNVGNQTLDPCFLLPDVQDVVCQPNPVTGEAGILVRLTEPLPQPDAIISREDSVWLVELEDRTICRLATGATGLVGDKRINYLCTPASARPNENLVILGDLEPGTTWTAAVATITLAGGKFTVQAAGTVPLRTVVRGPARFVPAECAALAQDLALMLGMRVEQGTAPFVDPLTGEGGIGCQVRAVGTGVVFALPPDTLLRNMLALQGWEEVRALRAGDAQETSAVFHQASIQCRLQTSVSAAGGSSCSTCQSLPDQQAHRIELTCSRDSSLPTGELLPRRRPRIEFAPGATAATLQQPMASGEIREFVLRAFGGQTMLLHIKSPRGDVVGEIYGLEDKTFLLHPTTNAPSWWGKLPATQDYVVRLAARGESTAVTFDVVIPAGLTVASVDKPTPVRARLLPGETMYYLFQGMAGDVITATVTSPGPKVIVSVAPLAEVLSEAPGISLSGRWTGTLPQTGDYVAWVFSDEAPVEYALEIVK